MFQFSEFRKAALQKKRESRAIPIKGGAIGVIDSHIDEHRDACKKVDWNKLMIESDKREPFAMAG